MQKGVLDDDQLVLPSRAGHFLCSSVQRLNHHLHWHLRMINHSSRAKSAPRIQIDGIVDHSVFGSVASLSNHSRTFSSVTHRTRNKVAPAGNRALALGRVVLVLVHHGEAGNPMIAACISTSLSSFYCGIARNKHCQQRLKVNDARTACSCRIQQLRGHY